MFFPIAAALGLTSTSYPGHLHTDAYDSHYYGARHPAAAAAATTGQHGYGGYGHGQQQHGYQQQQYGQQHSDPYYGTASGDYYDQVSKHNGY